MFAMSVVALGSSATSVRVGSTVPASGPPTNDPPVATRRSGHARGAIASVKVPAASIAAVASTRRLAALAGSTAYAVTVLATTGRSITVPLLSTIGPSTTVPDSETRLAPFAAPTNTTSAASAVTRSSWQDLQNLRNMVVVRAGNPMNLCADERSRRSAFRLGRRMSATVKITSIYSSISKKAIYSE
jgi:hypothetical protein